MNPRQSLSGGSRTLKMTVPHDDNPLVTDYITAFEKIISHSHDLREDDTTSP
ncbi:hypothetical protein [Actinoalloteichus fjordicus]|uniref:Uncharacterized protein n=1 Tax=Actinoalloteichus fjordicus TaxID=1612552 RepID=A0AAC9LGE8_9PSEU|nr:hypothetical protein [Actinoalloteichus fjordicus]APU17463.1 hypothetical protein UA74_27300 [Actinoalloteichus fjordicus]